LRNVAIRICTIDAFTERPFAGNPAAVCLLDDAPAWPEAGWMQSVAAEMNLSETAFLRRAANGVTFDLRWFTPVVEVPLCGHATLASAHLLFEAGILSPGTPAEFDTLSGRLTVHRTADGLAMDFPLQPVARVAGADVPDALRQGLGVSLVDVTTNESRYVVELADEETLQTLQPNLALLSTLNRACVVTCRSEMPGFDFVSRNFLPHRGIPEDPVTGAAHCSLADYWRTQLGKDTFTAYQASKRGGTVGVQINGDRVILTGQAVTVVRGTIEL
jgi:PhzF family phenazine biosynthesis protein